MDAGQIKATIVVEDKTKEGLDSAKSNLTKAAKDLSNAAKVDVTPKVDTSAMKADVNKAAKSMGDAFKSTVEDIQRLISSINKTNGADLSAANKFKESSKKFTSEAGQDAAVDKKRYNEASALGTSAKKSLGDQAKSNGIDLAALEKAKADVAALTAEADKQLGIGNEQSKQLAVYNGQLDAAIAKRKEENRLLQEAYNDVAKQQSANRSVAQGQTTVLDEKGKGGKGGKSESSDMQQLKQMQQEYKQVNAQMAVMRKNGKENTQQYKDLVARAKELKDVLKGSAKSTDAQDAETMKQRYKEVQDSLVSMRSMGKENTEEYKNLVEEAKQLKEVISGTPEKAQSVRAQLMAVKNEMMQLAAEGKTNTAEFQALADKANELQKNWKMVTSTTSGTTNMQTTLAGAAEAMSGLAGAGSAAVGIMTLMGEENEDLQKSMVKLQSVMSITSGLQQVANTLNSKSNAMILLRSLYTKALAASQTAETASETANTAATATNTAAKQASGTAATSAAAGTAAQTTANVANTASAAAGTAANITLAGAFKAVGAAIKSIGPFGWIVAAIGAIVGIVSKLTSESRKTAKEQKELNKAIAEGSAESISKLNALADAWKKLNTDTQKSQFLKEYRKELEALGVTLNNVAAANDFFYAQLGNAEELAKAEAEVAKLAEVVKESKAKLETANGDKRTEAEKGMKSAESWIARNKEKLAEIEASDEYKSGQLRAKEQAQMARNSIAAQQKQLEKWQLQYVNPNGDKEAQKDYDRQLKQYEEAQERLAKLKKRNKYSTENITKAEEEAEAARQQENEVANARIAAMNDGYNKQLAELKQRKKEQLQAIDKAEKELKDKNGGKPNDTQTANFASQRSAVEADYSRQVRDLSRERSKSRQEYERYFSNLSRGSSDATAEAGDWKSYTDLAKIDDDYTKSVDEIEEKRRQLIKDFEGGTLTKEEETKYEQQLNAALVDAKKKQDEAKKKYIDDLTKETAKAGTKSVKGEDAADKVSKDVEEIKRGYDEKIKEQEKKDKGMQEAAKAGIVSQDTADAYSEQSAAAVERIRKQSDESVAQYYVSVMKNAEGLIVTNAEEAERKRTETAKKYADARAQLQTVIDSSEATDEQKTRAQTTLGNLDNSEKAAMARIDLDEFKGSEQYTTIFKNIDNMGMTTLQALKEQMDVLGDSIRQGLNPADAQAFEEAVEGINNRLIELDPFTAWAEGRDAYSAAMERKEEALKEVTAAQKRYSTASKSLQKEENKEKKNAAKIADLRAEQAAASQELATANTKLAKAENDQAKASNKAKQAQQKVGEAFDDLLANMQNVADLMGEDASMIVSNIINIKSVVDTSIEGMKAASSAATTALKTIETASVILAIIGAVIQFMQMLDKFLGGDKTQEAYDAAVEKQQEVNKMTTAVNDYKQAVLEAQQAENSWFSNSGAQSLVDSWDTAQTALQAYNDKLNETQVKYVDKKGQKAGIWKSIVATGGAGILNGVNYWKDNQADDMSYVSAKDNLRFETKAAKHSTWFRSGTSQKTTDLRTWAKETYHSDLFNEDGMIDVEMAQNIIDNYGDKLVGETKATLEKLIEEAEAYQEAMDAFKEQIADWYSPPRGRHERRYMELCRHGRRRSRHLQGQRGRHVPNHRQGLHQADAQHANL